jgi:hypothetical protein
MCSQNPPDLVITAWAEHVPALSKFKLGFSSRNPGSVLEPLSTLRVDAELCEHSLHQIPLARNLLEPKMFVHFLLTT